MLANDSTTGRKFSNKKPFFMQDNRKMFAVRKPCNKKEKKRHCKTNKTNSLRSESKIKRKRYE